MFSEHADVEIQRMPSLWPDINELHPNGTSFCKKNNFGDPEHLKNLLKHSTSGIEQVEFLRKQWEARHVNLTRKRNEELDKLTLARRQADSKHHQIIGGRIRNRESDSIRPATKLTEQHSLDLEERSSIEGELYGYKEIANKLDALLSESLNRQHLLLKRLNVEADTGQQALKSLLWQLEKVDNLLLFALRNSPVVLNHQDMELRYRYSFNSFPTLQEKDLIGKVDDEIFNGMGLKEVVELKTEALEKKIPLTREIAFDTELFGRKTFLISVEPMVTKDEKVLGINVTSFDFTDEVARREKLACLREEVAVQRALENELHRAIHITEETTRAKQMLATMSHEIRSPLSGVVSMAEILAVTKLNGDQKQLIAVMVASGSLVLQLINDILDLSKVESGAMKLEANIFNPKDVLENVLQMATPSAKSKNLSLEGFVAKEVPLKVVGDVLRVQQVLVNLVSNAIKFTNEGIVGIILRVAASANMQNDSGALYSNTGKEHDNHFSTAAGYNMIVLQCVVFDTGIGIPDTHLPSLFDKFKQVNRMNTKKCGGTGLGLAICRQLVELMGGRLAVQSKENEGSIFSFTLPCKCVTPFRFCIQMQEKGIFEDQRKQFQPSSVPEKFNFLNFTQLAGIPPSSLQSILSRPFLRALGSIFATSNSIQTTDLYTQSCTSKSSHNPEPKLSSDFNNFPLASQDTRQTISKCDEVASYSNTATSRSIEHGKGISNNWLKSDRNLAIASESVEEEKQCIDMYEHSNSLSQLAFQITTKSNILLETQDRFKSQGQLLVDQKDASRLEPLIFSPRKPRILLAEDNKVNVMVAQSMLRRLGLSLEVVYNGSEAVHAVQEHRYDLILMDICMPVMDGLEATCLIRKYEEENPWSLSKRDNGFDCTFPNQLLQIAPSSKAEQFSKTRSILRTPIIAVQFFCTPFTVTANALADDVRHCYEQGMDYFVAKPLTFEKLKQVFFQFIPWFMNQNDCFMTIRD